MVNRREYVTLLGLGAGESEIGKPPRRAITWPRIAEERFECGLVIPSVARNSALISSSANQGEIPRYALSKITSFPRKRESSGGPPPSPG